VKLVAADLVLHVSSESQGHGDAEVDYAPEIPAVIVVKPVGELHELGPCGVGVAHLRHPGDGCGPHLSA